jgi:hypothetical protein
MEKELRVISKGFKAPKTVQYGITIGGVIESEWGYMFNIAQQPS